MPLSSSRILAGIALILLSPLMVLIALVVAGGVGFPVFFRQHRAGLGGRPFRLVKFRTMTMARGRDGRLLPDDQRTPPIGRLLRRSRLDELPELWNILRGDMAFIGPRPLLPETVRAMGQAGVQRGAVRPGLTGLAQVSGNTLLSPSAKVALDVWYVEHRSLRLDISILARTLLVMLRGERLDPITLRRAHAGSRRRSG